LQSNKKTDDLSSAFRLNMARPEGFEPPTPKFVAWCSIQLSYGRAVQERNCANPDRLGQSRVDDTRLPGIESATAHSSIHPGKAGLARPDGRCIAMNRTSLTGSVIDRSFVDTPTKAEREG
jgi:hypothetical protein